MKKVLVHKILISIFDYASSKFYRGQSQTRKKNIPKSEFSRWFKDKGDQTLRLDYPLA